MFEVMAVSLHTVTLLMMIQNAQWTMSSLYSLHSKGKKGLLNIESKLTIFLEVVKWLLLGMGLSCPDS